MQLHQSSRGSGSSSSMGLLRTPPAEALTTHSCKAATRPPQLIRFQIVPALYRPPNSPAPTTDVGVLGVDGPHDCAPASLSNNHTVMAHGGLHQPAAPTQPAHSTSCCNPVLHRTLLPSSGQPPIQRRLRCTQASLPPEHTHRRNLPAPVAPCCGHFVASTAIEDRINGMLPTRSAAGCTPGTSAPFTRHASVQSQLADGGCSPHTYIWRWPCISQLASWGADIPHVQPTIVTPQPAYLHAEGSRDPHNPQYWCPNQQT